MRRTTMTAAAALAALALTAGSHSAWSADVTKRQCEDAWAASPAYSECGPRTDAPGSTAESVEVGSDTCKIATGCVYWVAGQGDRGGEGSFRKERRSTSWQGGLDDTRRVQNCTGHLKRLC